ncbi:MAG TPA: alpha/beta fold hydrolase [Povalibacter sp.]
MNITRHSLSTQNGAVVLQTYAPAQPPAGIVIVPSAMGVAQSYYARFAQWLAGQGYLVVTFDYRGVGLSAPPSLRDFKADIFDWARDCAAVIDFATQQLPGAPLYWLGHSLGGQLLGLIANRDRIRRVVTVAAGSGYWMENSWPLRGIVWWLWFVAVPLATRIAGYFPGKRLRKVGDLPRGVIEQWRRWCLNSEYVVGAEGEAVRAEYSSVQAPMLAISFTDDELMTDQGIRSLHRLYTQAPVAFRRIAPGDVGVRQIGHFGFFRPQFEQSLWAMVPRWLQEGR